MGLLLAILESWELSWGRGGFMGMGGPLSRVLGGLLIGPGKPLCVSDCSLFVKGLVGPWIPRRDPRVFTKRLGIRRRNHYFRVLLARRLPTGAAIPHPRRLRSAVELSNNFTMACRENIHMQPFRNDAILLPALLQACRSSTLYAKVTNSSWYTQDCKDPPSLCQGDTVTKGTGHKATHSNTFLRPTQTGSFGLGSVGGSPQNSMLWGSTEFS